jgi:hypothetical protein
MRIQTEGNTYLQCDSPRGDDAQTPPFLQGLGEHETNPGTSKIKENHQSWIVDLSSSLIVFHRFLLADVQLH